MRIDLHAHSAISDGTDTPAGVVLRARDLGIDVLALTDHDTFDGLPEALACGTTVGVRVVRGVEVSCTLLGSSVHLVGYGPREEDEDLAEELRRIRQGRSGRVPAMLAKLHQLGYPLTMAEVEAQVGDSPSVGRPHIADALVAKGFFPDRNAVFDSLLADGGPAFVDRYAPDVRHALRLLRAAGAATVLAHPWGRGSRRVLDETVLASLAHDYGLDGIEVDHTDHDESTRAELRAIAERVGLLVTGSSDYHGAGKRDNELGCNLTDPLVFHALMDVVSTRGGRP